MPNLQEQIQYEIEHFDKQAVLKEIRAAQAKFAAKYPQKQNFFREEVYDKLLSDPARVRAYCQAKVMNENMAKCQQIQKEHKMRYLDGRNVPPSGIDRAIYLYMDPSGTPEADQQNKELLDLYYSPNRGELQKRIIGDAFRINVQGLTRSFDAGDIAKTMDYCLEHEKEARLGWIFADITSDNKKGYVFDPAFKEATDRVSGVYQSVGVYETLSTVMGSPLAFCVEDVKELSSDLGPSTMLSALYKKDDPDATKAMKAACNGSVNLAQQASENEQYQKFFQDNPEIDLDNPYTWKVTDKDEHEIKMDDAILNGKGLFDPRPEDEIPTAETIGQPETVDIVFRKQPPGTKVLPFEVAREQSNETLKMLRDDRGKPMKGDPTRVTLEEFRRLADMHFKRKKPNGIFFFFRTKAAKAHSAERELMNEYVSLLKERGVSDDLLNKISDRKHANEPLTEEDFKRERQNVENCQKEKYGVGLDLPDLSDEKMRPNFVADNAAFSKEVEVAADQPAVGIEEPQKEGLAKEAEKVESIEEKPLVTNENIV